MADCKHDIYFNLPGVDKKTFKRNSDMSFDKTISNILYFIETNDNKINVHIKTELDDNCGYKEKDIIGFWKSLDIEKNKKKQVQFELMFPSDRAGNLKGEFDLKIYMAKIFGCNFRVLLDNLYIIQNGDVVTCCNDWYNNMTLGNLLKSNLSDIINSDKYWTFFKWIYGIEEAPQNFICRRCYNSIGFGSRPKEFIGGKKYGGD